MGRLLYLGSCAGGMAGSGGRSNCCTCGNRTCDAASEVRRNGHAAAPAASMEGCTRGGDARSFVRRAFDSRHRAWWRRVTELGAFGEPTDDVIRVEMLDEALAIIIGPWCGETFSFRGKHYTVNETQFLRRPLQFPRIPIGLPAHGPPARPR